MGRSDEQSNLTDVQLLPYGDVTQRFLGVVAVGGGPVSFQEILDEAVETLRRQGRVSYRALRRQFTLDDAALDDLKFELIHVLRVARDEDEQMLVWSRDTERRQLTVMFCDLADSTALSSRLDPEDLREVIRAYQEACVAVVQRSGGHVAQYLGDGLLVYFGYPHAQEDAATRAVRAGLEILEAMGEVNARQHGAVELSVRVGIHTGPVIVGEVGAGGRHEQLALGETPNLAARIQGLADRNSVVISAATHSLVGGYFTCDCRGPQALKGIPDPVTVYRVLQESGARNRLEAAHAAGLTPLVGRQAELTLLLDRWEAAKSEHRQVACVSGEPGIGKSRLAHELKKRVEEDGCASVELRSSPHLQNSAWRPVIDHFEQLLAFTRGEMPEERIARLESLLVNDRQPLSEVMPLLAPLLSLPLLDRYPAPLLTPDQRREKTQEILVRWMVDLAERQPVLVVCEDLHWADPSTLELLGSLIARAPTARLFIVVTFRPEFYMPWNADAHIKLERFTDAQVNEMVGRLTASTPLPLNVIEQVVAKTDGVPLFVEELTKMLLETDLNGAIAIPATLKDSLMARLDRLRTGKLVAQLAAVLGREFAYDVLHAVSPWEAEILHRGLEQLLEAELVRETEHPSRLTYQFKHALVRDTAYQSLLRSTRQQYHGRIGRVLSERFPETAENQPDLLAHHFREAGLHPEAIEYLDRANQQAIQANALTEALRYFEDAAGLLDGEPEGEGNDRRRLDLVARQVVVFRGLFRYPEYHALLERHEAMAARLGDAGLQAAINARLGHCEYAVAEFDRSLTRLRSAAPLCEAHGRFEDAALAYMAWAFAANGKGDHEEALAIGAQALRATDEQFHLQYRILAGFARTVALAYMGRWFEAIAESDRALDDAERYDHDGSRVMIWSALAMTHAMRGDPTLAVDYGRKAVEKAPTPVERSIALIGLAHGLCLGTAPHEGIELLAPVLAMARAAGHRAIESFAVLLGEGHLRNGNTATGRAILDDTVQFAQRFGSRYAEARAQRLLGELAADENRAQQEPPLAAPAFERALALFRAMRAENEVALTQAAYGRVLKEQECFAEARRRLTEALHTFERLGTLVQPERVRAELAALPA